MYNLNEKKSLAIIGSGGHAKVIIETAELSGFNIESVYDDDIRKANSYISGYKVQGPINNNSDENSIIAIGDNITRRNLCFNNNKLKWATIIHPSSIISKNVLIGEGTVIMAGVIIQSGAKIGKHCILNTGACIDHDCVIGDFVHISPKCGLAGSVFIGEGTSIGIGCSIIPNISIGIWSIIGAGSVVVNNLPDYCTAVGAPSKAIKFQNVQK